MCTITIISQMMKQTNSFPVSFSYYFVEPVNLYSHLCPQEPNHYTVLSLHLLATYYALGLCIHKNAMHAIRKKLRLIHYNQAWIEYLA